MSYEPTTWKDGDLVTSAKLNKLEQGVANSGASIFMVNATYNENDDITTLDKTAGEIIEAFQHGLVLISGAYNQDTFSALLTEINYESENYYVNFNGMRFLANTLDDYPISG